MDELDEDALLDLHGRVRRARTKYVKLYRRQASVRVGDTGGRGAARPMNRRNADKAEVFEIAFGPGASRSMWRRRAAAQLNRNGRPSSPRRKESSQRRVRTESLLRGGRRGRPLAPG